MKKRLSTLIPLFCGLLFATLPCPAQSVINSSGGSAQMNNQTFEWSIGELVITTSTSTDLDITQGLLQPAEDEIGIANISDPAQLLSVYPNPVRDILHIRPRLQANSWMKYQLIDLSGKSILSQETRLRSGQEMQTIYLKTLVPGMYLLNIQIYGQTAHQRVSYLLAKQE